MNRLRKDLLNALHRLAARPRVAPLLAVYRGAPTVRHSVRFGLRELLHFASRHDRDFYRIRDSGLQVAIRHGAAPTWILAEIFNRRCYEPPGEAGQAIGEIRTILDLGANIGLFGLFAVERWPNSRIVAFEPDDENAQLQELTIAANKLAARWELVKAAASNRDGRALFAMGQNATSRVVDAASENTVEVQMVDVLPRIAAVDLVKMDIEGGEWAILCDPRFRETPPRAIVLEYHVARSPGRDPRAEAESLLRAAGMNVQPAEDRGDGHGVLWAWRTDRP